MAKFLLGYRSCLRSKSGELSKFRGKTLYSTNGSAFLGRVFHELLSRDHEDGRATWQPQGVGSEAYLNGTS